MPNQKLLKMYNLNVNVATTLPMSFLGLDNQCNTPRTPEIVNSLVAMTNPFDGIMKSTKGNNSPGSEESCSGTVSPLGSPISSPPSVQHTRSQLIKEGLKLTIQTKRKHSASETKEDFEESESKRMKKEELTEEDEERRKRRRERNKIAATKCRMKKREKTANLVNESEVLETQNIDLKAQIQDLQKQKRKLMDMLSMHSATCIKQSSTIQPQGFEEFVAPTDSFSNRFENSTFCPDASGENFEVGSTNGTAMNPYGKDPNFAAKLLDDVSSSTPYSRTYDRSYVLLNTFRDSSSGGNHYQMKNRLNETNGKVRGNRSCYEFQSDKKSEKDKRSDAKKMSTFEEEAEVFRTSFHDNNDVDSYKPNGVVDTNFFASRPEIFATGNDYVSAFSNNQLDNGCMA